MWRCWRGGGDHQPIPAQRSPQAVREHALSPRWCHPGVVCARLHPTQSADYWRNRSREEAAINLMIRPLVDIFLLIHLQMSFQSQFAPWRLLISFLWWCWMSRSPAAEHSNAAIRWMKNYSVQEEKQVVWGELRVSFINAVGSFLLEIQDAVIRLIFIIAGAISSIQKWHKESINIPGHFFYHFQHFWCIINMQLCLFFTQVLLA